MRVGSYGRLSTKELMLSNCVVGEDSWESFGLQGDQTSESQRESSLNIHSEGWCWSRSSNPLPTWCEEPAHWKRPWCCARLKQKGEVAEDEMGREHHWLNGHEFEQTLGDSGGKRSLAESMVLQIIGHNLATEQQQQSGRVGGVRPGNQGTVKKCFGNT